MSDLASAMIYSPNLKVLLNAGYFDLVTPFYVAACAMHHLPMADKLQKNIEYAFYPSGHMAYVNAPSLKKLHGNVARFIAATHGAGPSARMIPNKRGRTQNVRPRVLRQGVGSRVSP